MIALFTLVLIFTWVPFAQTTLWHWFLVPLGLPEVGIAHMVGLSLALGLIRFKGHISDDETPDPEDLLAATVVVPAVALGIGFIAQRIAF